MVGGRGDADSRHSVPFREPIAREINRGLADRLRREGMRSLDEAVGAAHR